MKIFALTLSVVFATASCYNLPGEDFYESQNIQPFARSSRVVRQGYGSGGGRGYGSSQPVNFGWSGGQPQGYNRPVSGGYGGGFEKPPQKQPAGGYGTNLPLVDPIPPSTGGFGSGYGNPSPGPLKPVGNGYANPAPAPLKPVGSGYANPAPGNPGYGGVPQTGGPGYNSQHEDVLVDSYVVKPVKPGFGVPEKAPTGPVGYGR